MTPISISCLRPGEELPKNATIQAVVTLLWPYGSSSRQCALLLADPDFRQRNERGQIRIQFESASAEAVAKCRLGIGDTVVLSLEGGKWTGQMTAIITLGRKGTPMER